MEFLIESKQSMYNQGLIPCHDFGFATIDKIEFQNWWDNEKVHSYILTDNINTNQICNHKLTEILPVGSVEFCLNFYKRYKIENIKPLNIPKELWCFCNRYIDIRNSEEFTGKFFAKSIDRIKSPINDVYEFPKQKLNEKVFATEWVDNIISEWRCFIYRGEILGIRNYSGDEWILPDKKYIQKIVDFFDCKVYTLDIMISDDGTNDITELHEFFSCGLYSFNHQKLLNMMIDTHKEILKRG